MLTLPAALEVCAFRVGGHCFAVDSRSVAEVLTAASLAAVPLAPQAIVGLLHLRGRIVPVIDLREPLELPSGDESPRRVHLVIRVADDWYSLLVDEVLDVQVIPGDRIEHAATPSGRTAGDAITGVFADTDRLIHILDPERVVQSLGKPRS
jgi:purine-binding chemotaxis protein CheW